MTSSSSRARAPTETPAEVSKRMRVMQQLSTGRRCSQEALAQILQTLQDNGVLNETTCRSSKEVVKHDAKQALAMRHEAQTPYGSVVQHLSLPLKDEPDFEWPILHPAALLHQLSRLSRSYADALLELIGSTTNELRIIVYIDEINPGNPLRPDAGRTTQCLYWTFADFPPAVLAQEEAWLLFGCLQAKIAKKLPAGVSYLAKRMLHVFFKGRFNLATGTTIATRDGGLVLCRCSFGGFLADEKALKEIFCIKGASGLKPCFSCKNLIKADDVGDDAYLVPLDCCDKRRLDPHTRESIYECVDLLRQRKSTLNKKKFQELQMFLGMTWNEDALLFDDSLRDVLSPIDNYIRDWMHAVVAGGIGGTEIAAFVLKLKKEGVSLEQIGQHACLYTLPKRLPPPSMKWFDPKMISEETQMRTQASENLTIIALVDAFVQDVCVPLGILPRHCECFRLLRDITRLLAEASMLHLSALEAKIAKHAVLFVELYPEHVKPKFHHMLHLVDDYRGIGRILSCFVTERKHKAIKSAAVNGFKHVEATITTLIVNDLFDKASKNELLNSIELLNPKCIEVGTLHMQRSTQARLHCGVVHAGDVVQLDSKAAGVVQDFWQELPAGPIQVRVAMYTQLDLRTFDTRYTEAALLIDAKIVLQAVGWAPQGPHVARLLL